MRTSALAVLAAAALSVAGCSYFEKQDADQAESTLAAAGFRMKPADTPEKLAKLQAMPKRTIFTREKDGETVYLYADPDFCKCLYAGLQPAFDRYQRLSIAERMSQERVEAAEMNEDAAMDWGMWGPFW